MSMFQFHRSIKFFLQDIAEFGHAPLDPKQDTAFAIFLKIVIAACDKIPDG
jgi:hypothetical protein